MSDPSLSVFTPSNTAPEDLEFILVQRQGILQDAVERVRESALTGHKHHLLFVGPRGCGKTHLITLIVHRVGLDGNLADRLRIAWLNEDETCTTLLEFLLKIHAALEKRYPTEFNDGMLAPAFDMKPDAALEFVSKHVLEALGSRTLMVAAENLDAIFENLGDAGQKQLRAFIQENPKLTIVATAQRLVESLSDRANPFYGFFQTEHLKPLNVEDATELLKNIAKLRDNGEVVKFLDTRRGLSRVRALHHLSGGNHRIYIVLSQFITRDSVDALVAPFMKMVDELTPYYQERVRWLPPLQRKIVEFLCSCETTVPVKEIARRLFSTPQTISSQLQGLREKGYIEANQRGRESLYEISEPMMRICVEVKENQRFKPLRLLVDFLRVWYDDQELSLRLCRSDLTTASKLYLESAIERNQAEGNLRSKILLDDLLSSLPVGTSEKRREDLAKISGGQPEAFITAMRFMIEGNSAEAISCLNEEIAVTTEVSEKVVLLLTLAGLHGHLGDNEGEIRDYTAVIELSGAPLDKVTQAFYNRGFKLNSVGESQRAIRDFSAVIELHGVPVDFAAKALLYRGIILRKAGDRQGEIRDYAAVIELPGAPGDVVAKALLVRGMTFEIEGDSQAAIKDYSAVIKLPRTSVEDIALALHLRGLELFRTNQKTEARTDFESLIQLNGAPVYTVVDTFLGLSEIHWNEAIWADGLQTLDSGLGYGKRDDPPYFGTSVDLISIIFQAGLSPESRRLRVAELVGIYQKHGALPVLGDGLVKHLGAVFRAGAPFPSSDNLNSWLIAWEQATADVDEFRLPLRLLRTGVEFVIAGGKDTGILLDLTSPERQILKQALGLEESKP